MALAKLLLMFLPLLLQICTAAPQRGIDQEILHDEPIAINKIRKALKKSDIIPDVLDDFHPSFTLNVTYPRTHKSVKLGNTISPSDVEHSPDIHIYPSTHSSLLPPSANPIYALILTDPDATSRSDPKQSEMCHWIVTNTTHDSSDSSIHFTLPLAMPDFDVQAKPWELIEYLAPSPPPKTGKHRYVFVLLVGTEGRNLTKPEERPHWGYGKVRHGVRDWAEENGLSVVAANFFYAKNKKQ